MKSKYRNIFLIFGIVAIVVMLCTFDMEYDELLANLRRAGIWLPAVVGLWIIIYLFNTLSWYIIIRDGKKGTPIPFWKVYKLTVSGFALNYATPGTAHLHVRPPIFTDKQAGVKRLTKLSQQLALTDYSPTSDDSILRIVR